MEIVTTDQNIEIPAFTEDAALWAGLRLHSYLSFRAELEGVECRLTEQFFAQQFRNGVRTFFGVEVCDCCGNLLCDWENPEAFDAFNGVNEEEASHEAHPYVH